MRRLIATLACFATLTAITTPHALSSASGDVSYVAEQPVSNVPLVVIRFNQRKVMYERQLYNAISKAVEIKPSVVLDVVSFVPTTGNASNDEKVSQAALGQTSTVVTSLRNMGIPQERMRVSTEGAPGLPHHEVHIYVE